MSKNLPHFIDGKWVEGEGTPLISSDPASAEVIGEGKEATVSTVNQAIEAAASALPGWSNTHLETRINLLKRFQGILETQREDLATLISRETGKVTWEAQLEADICVNKIDVSLQAFRERCGVTEKEVPFGSSVTRFKPHGVVAVYGPYNFPAHLPNGHIVPALLAGNTVVFKPSEFTPAVGAFLVELWEEVGLPSGVLNLVQGGRDTGIALAKHPRLDGLFFTGSARTGCALAEQFGKHPEKILALEMGGNNPLVIESYDDIQAAAYLTLQSAFVTTGQRCTCARRLILCESAEPDALLEKIQVMTKNLAIGPYTSSSPVFCGPLIHREAAQKALKTQEALKALGGKSLLDMRSLEQGEAFVSPGILDMTQAEPAPDDECFAPLLQVIRVKDLDEAIQAANNTRYGLSAGIVTRERASYLEFYRRCRSGVINWNSPLFGALSTAPFGGLGISGNHRPSAYFATDYCSYPVASIENRKVKLPKQPAPGVQLEELSRP